MERGKLFVRCRIVKMSRFIDVARHLWFVKLDATFFKKDHLTAGIPSLILVIFFIKNGTRCVQPYVHTAWKNPSVSDRADRDPISSTTSLKRIRLNTTKQNTLAKQLAGGGLRCHGATDKEGCFWLPLLLHQTKLAVLVSGKIRSTCASKFENSTHSYIVPLYAKLCYFPRMFFAQKFWLIFLALCRAEVKGGFSLLSPCKIVYICICMFWTIHSTTYRVNGARPRVLDLKNRVKQSLLCLSGDSGFRPANQNYPFPLHRVVKSPTTCSPSHLAPHTRD